MGCCPGSLNRLPIRLSVSQQIPLAPTVSNIYNASRTQRPSARVNSCTTEHEAAASLPRRVALLGGAAALAAGSTTLQQAKAEPKDLPPKLVGPQQGSSAYADSSNSDSSSAGATSPPRSLPDDAARDELLEGVEACALDPAGVYAPSGLSSSSSSIVAAVPTSMDASGCMGGSCPPPLAPPAAQLLTPATLPLYATFAASSLSACTAEVATLPLDTAKVRLQIQASSADAKYSGLLGTMLAIAREEGPSALWKGMEPGLHRQFLNGGLRIGMYEPVQQALLGAMAQMGPTVGAAGGIVAAGAGAAGAASAAGAVGDVPLQVRVLSGLITGALAMCVANPTDLVKVRMQSEGKLPPGAPRRYPSALKAYSIIAKSEGIGGLWTGIGPNVARNAIINAVELATYFEVKQSLIGSGYFQDDVVTHLLSGLGAGFLAVCVGSPVDVMKSRMMADTARYKGVVDCFVQTARTDGVAGFYQGFIPNFVRLGTWNVAMFLVLEQVKKLLRLLMFQ